jgi:tRNA(fMet)-specific endonuclease VapC
MRYLLDTNILSDLIRNPEGHAASRLRSTPSTDVATSIIVSAELRYGAVKKGSAVLSRRVEAVLDVIEILPFEHPADVVYAEVRSELERKGQPIGANDLLIASQSIAFGMILVTDNLQEFERIKSLAVENWLTRNLS